MLGLDCQNTSAPLTLKNRDGTAVTDENGVVRITRSWARSEQMYVDFVLRVEVRALEPLTEAVITLRAEEKRDEEPQGTPILLAPELGASVPGRWRQLEIRAEGSQFTAKLDGMAFAPGRVERPIGYIVLAVRKGAAEFRNVMISPIARP
jgi:hypothetical protein